MSWIDTAEGAAGVVGTTAVVVPVLWKFAKPWVREVLLNTQATAANTAQLQDDAKTLRENGGSSLKDKANVAADSSVRTEHAVEKLVDKLDAHLIASARKEAQYDLVLKQLTENQQKLLAANPTSGLLSVPVILPPPASPYQQS